MKKEEVINLLQGRIQKWEEKPKNRTSRYYGLNERVGEIIQNLKDSVEDIKEEGFPDELLIVYADLGIDKLKRI